MLHGFVKFGMSHSTGQRTTPHKSMWYWENKHTCSLPYSQDSQEGTVSDLQSRAFTEAWPTMGAGDWENGTSWTYIVKEKAQEQNLSVNSFSSESLLCLQSVNSSFKLILISSTHWQITLS